jgi:hypothetical protein
MNGMKFETSMHPTHAHHLQVTHVPFQDHLHFDLNQNYVPDRSQAMYSPIPLGPSISMPTQSTTPSVSSNAHPMLGPRYSGGSTGSNVLMLPPAHQPRGGSLPDLRTGNSFHSQTVSFPTVPSPPSSLAPQFFRILSTQENSEADLFILVNDFHCN